MPSLRSWETLTSPRTVFISLVLTSITYYAFPCHKLLRHILPSSWLDASSNVSGFKSYTNVTILYWTRVPKSGLHDMASCNELLGTKCVITANRSFLHGADALIFKGMHIDVKDYPTFRSPNQSWVYADAEAPGRSWQKRERLANKFNWTMTYRSNSDIPEPYGFTIPRQTAWSEDTFNKYFQRMFKKKRKLATWLVSHCSAPSQRDNVVADLRKLMPVDVYGHCGKLRCKKETKNKIDCFRTLSNEYKFYLAFENSICSEYITEKAFNPLTEDVVPVVYNGADNAAILPPNSFIDILSYDNLTALVNHILELDQNEDLYRKYFEWKRNYEIGDRMTNGWCGLCKKLSEEKLRSTPQNKTYADIVQYQTHFEGGRRRLPTFLKKHWKKMSPKVPACNLFQEI